MPKSMTYTGHDRKNASAPPPAASSTEPRQRVQIGIRGAVQGVGFRPFVYRLTGELNLGGFVRNSARGVEIEVEGPPPAVEEFCRRLRDEAPPLARMIEVTQTPATPLGTVTFEILHSEAAEEKTAVVLPDIATCDDCLREMFDPADRRHLYPFTNCTNCGPRFSIVTALPYDRANTTMAAFKMCRECRAEYQDPSNRRFHAQPNACPVCGPQLALWDATGDILALGPQVIQDAAVAIRAGQIVAMKGIGGFLLLVDAGNESAVARLRERKCREEKPFALMAPSPESIRSFCDVTPQEEHLLRSPQAPIVLLKRTAPWDATTSAAIAPSVAPHNPYLGVMLPYSPLHHILMRELGVPVVATSGNLSDEPICTDETDALRRLERIADMFLVHNRPIARRVDDSIAMIVDGRPVLLRRARGYAPFPVELARPALPILAVGGHLKSTIAIARGSSVFISQHIGDLETPEALVGFKEAVSTFTHLYEFTPGFIACDRHPDYVSSRYATGFGKPLIPVQHHIAHVYSCMADNQLEPPVLGVSWDGTGLGLDGTIWGGEFIVVDGNGARRAAHLRCFPLPGGDAAVREPWRSALGLLHAIYGQRLAETSHAARLPWLTCQASRTVVSALERGINSPLTSSAGRLFDAVSALLGLRSIAAFEGQAAMMLQFEAEKEPDETGEYDMPMVPPADDDAPAMLDWEMLLTGICKDLGAGVAVSTIAARFHNTLAAGIVRVAQWAGVRQVALTGGCFQNRLLAAETARRLRNASFQPYMHCHVPPNDNGLALGQLVAACCEIEKESTDVPGSTR